MPKYTYTHVNNDHLSNKNRILVMLLILNYINSYNNYENIFDIKMEHEIFTISHILIIAAINSYNN